MLTTFDGKLKMVHHYIRPRQKLVCKTIVGALSIVMLGTYGDFQRKRSRLV